MCGGVLISTRTRKVVALPADMTLNVKVVCPKSVERDASKSTPSVVNVCGGPRQVRALTPSEQRMLRRKVGVHTVAIEHGAPDGVVGHLEVHRP